MGLAKRTSTVKCETYGFVTSSSTTGHSPIMDIQEEAKVTERAIPTKFEKRDWFLENLRLLLSLDLNQDPADEDSRSEWLRLHYLELTVSDRTRLEIGSILMASPPLDA